MDSLQSQGSDHEMCSRAAQLFNVTAEDSSDQRTFVYQEQVFIITSYDDVSSLNHTHI